MKFDAGDLEYVTCRIPFLTVYLDGSLSKEYHTRMHQFAILPRLFNSPWRPKRTVYTVYCCWCVHMEQCKERIVNLSCKTRRLAFFNNIQFPAYIAAIYFSMCILEFLILCSYRIPSKSRNRKYEFLIGLLSPQASFSIIVELFFNIYHISKNRMYIRI
jgi:hypothetical protein